jgi:RhoGEF domain
MRQKRGRLALELLATERAYVRNMTILSEQFLAPLCKRYAAEESFAAVAGDVKVLIGYNRVLLGDLEKRISSDASEAYSSELGSVFMLMSSFLKTYKQYTAHYAKVMSRIRLLQKDAKFAQHLESLKSDETRGKGLRDFMIMPVQRVPRYLMLISSLSESTWHAHPDFAKLRVAKEKLEELADYLEASQEEAARQQRVFEIFSSLSGSKMPSLSEFVQPQRCFVGEHEARYSDGAKTDIDGRLYVFNDMLVVAKRRGAKLIFSRRIDIADLKAVERSADAVSGADSADSNTLVLARATEPSARIVLQSAAVATTVFEQLTHAMKELYEQRQEHIKRQMTAFSRQSPNIVVVASSSSSK